MTRAETITAERKKSTLYSDFLTDLVPHPVTKDIVKFTNENAVAKAIRNLILTDRGERLFQPTLGSNIKKLLFEPMSDATSRLITDFVSDAITRHEPRAKVTEIKTLPDYDRGLYNITITFITINIQQPITVNVTLERVR